VVNYIYQLVSFTNVFSLCFPIVVDVSAQSCTITPRNPDNLDPSGGVIVNGMENVMIECRCVDGNGNAPRRVRWFDPSMSRVTGQTSGNPYSNNNNNNGRSTLVIPTFSDSTSGIYTCGNNNNYADITTMLAINLQLGKD